LKQRAAQAGMETYEVPPQLLADLPGDGDQREQSAMRIEAQRLLQQLRHAWWLWQACQPSELPERFKTLVARFIELRAFPSFLIILWCFLSLCLALHNVSTTPNFL
jgi:hypothetical protein